MIIDFMRSIKWEILFYIQNLSIITNTIEQLKELTNNELFLTHWVLLTLTDFVFYDIVNPILRNIIII